MPNSEIIRAAKLCSDSYFDRSPQIYDRDCDVQGFLKVESGELWIIFQGSKNLKDWISNFSFYQHNVARIPLLSGKRRKESKALSGGGIATSIKHRDSDTTILFPLRVIQYSA